MNRGQFAMWTLLVGGVLGIIGAIFFFDSVPGISALLFTVMVIGGVVYSARQAGRAITWRNMWPVVPMLFFSGMVSVYASAYLIGLNIIFTAILGLLFVHFIIYPRSLDESSGLSYVSGILEAFTGVVLIDPIVNGREAAGWIKRQKHDTFFSVMRGLAIALPIFILFAVFLSRSDLYFAEQLSRFWRVFAAPIELLLPWTGFALGLAWLVSGAIAYAVARDWETDTDADEQPTGGFTVMMQRLFIPVAVVLVTGGALTYLSNPFAERFGEWVYVWAWVAALAVAWGAYSTLEARYQRGATELDDEAGKNEKKARFGWLQIGIVESAIVLGAVNLLFAGYVFTQFAPRIDLTYADVARRGFFELVIVSVMVITLLLVMDAITIRRNPTQDLTVRGLSVVTVVLTVVLLVFAWLRINSYIDVYGYTHRRVWVQVFMPWMVVLFAALLLHLFHVRRNVFSTGALLVVIGYLVTMNLLNINMFVGRHNVDRYLSGEHELDLCYLLDLSADAAPQLIRLAEETDDAAIQFAVGRNLTNTQQRLNRPAYDSVFAYNVSATRVRRLLANRKPQLETYLANRTRFDCVMEPINETLAQVE
ncbi:MAG: DUF4173 domain-containing protein [Chloroflexota bacterium]